MADQLIINTPLHVVARASNSSNRFNGFFTPAYALPCNSDSGQFAPLYG